MGNLYYAVNDTDKSYYELGKRLFFWQIDNWPATDKQIEEAVLDTIMPSQLDIGWTNRVILDLQKFNIERIVCDASGEVPEEYVCKGSFYNCAKADKVGLTWEQNCGQ